jgi:hypothetical protein
LEASADILLLLNWNNPREKGVLTGKLFEYIAAERPILSMGLIDNEASKVIKKEGFGLSSNSEKEVAEFILNVRNKNFQEKFKKAIELNKHKYSRKLQVNKLEEILNRYCLKS